MWRLVGLSVWWLTCMAKQRRVAHLIVHVAAPSVYPVLARGWSDMVPQCRVRSAQLLLAWAVAQPAVRVPLNPSKAHAQPAATAAVTIPLADAVFTRCAALAARDPDPTVQAVACQLLATAAALVPSVLLLQTLTRHAFSPALQLDATLHPPLFALLAAHEDLAHASPGPLFVRHGVAGALLNAIESDHVSVRLAAIAALQGLTRLLATQYGQFLTAHLADLGDAAVDARDRDPVSLHRALVAAVQRHGHASPWCLVPSPEATLWSLLSDADAGHGHHERSGAVSVASHSYRHYAGPAFARQSQQRKARAQRGLQRLAGVLDAGSDATHHGPAGGDLGAGEEEDESWVEVQLAGAAS